MKQLFSVSLLILLFLSSYSQTQWSVYSGPNSEQDAVSFGVTGVRNAVNLQTGFGLQRMQKGYDYYTNVIYKSGNNWGKAIPTAAQIPAAKAYLIQLLKAAPFLPRMLLVENEENWNEANGSVGSYLAWFDAVAEVGRMFNIPVSNGGVTMPAMNAVAYNYLIATGQPDEAKAFKSRNRIGRQQLAQASWVLSEMAALGQAGYSHIPFNFHYQFTDKQSVTDFTLCVKAIEYYGFVSKMNNEVAQRNYDASITVAGAQACSLLDYATWYNTTGDSGQAVTLTSVQINGFRSVRNF